MIDINELRQRAQAATPGPWVAKNVSGSGLEIHMAHPVYPDKEWPAFGTDSAFCKKGLVSYETWTQFPYEVQNVQQSKNAEFIAAANPATVIELLDRLEAAEKERDELRTELKEVRREVAMTHYTINTLQAKIKTMERQEPVGSVELDEIKIALHRALELGKRETWTGAKKYRSREDQREEQQCWDKVWTLLSAKGE